MYSAAAEDALHRMGFDRFADYAEAAAGFDAGAFLRGLLTGEAPGAAEAFRALLDGLCHQAREAFTSLARQLAAPAVICAALRLALGRDRAAAGMAELVCVLTCAAALTQCYAQARAEAAAFLDAMVRASGVLTPVMASACALTGATASAAMLAPLAAEGSALAEFALRDAGLSLCSAAGAVAVAGSLSPRFKLDRLFELLKSAVRWLLGAAMLLFGGLAAAQGGMGAARDSAAVRAAKTALEALVPAIGGLPDATGALAVSAGTLRRAVGITGAAFIGHLCAAPLTKLGAAMLSAKLAAAALEPLSDSPAAALAGRFAELIELLLAICIACAAMTALLAGGCAAGLFG